MRRLSSGAMILAAACLIASPVLCQENPAFDGGGRCYCAPVSATIALWYLVGARGLSGLADGTGRDGQIALAQRLAKAMGTDPWSGTSPDEEDYIGQFTLTSGAGNFTGLADLNEFATAKQTFDASVNGNLALGGIVEHRFEARVLQLSPRGLRRCQLACLQRDGRTTEGSAEFVFQVYWLVPLPPPPYIFRHSNLHVRGHQNL